MTYLDPDSEGTLEANTIGLFEEPRLGSLRIATAKPLASTLYWDGRHPNRSF